MSSPRNHYEEARTHIPGGVNSPARDYSGVGLRPPFIRRGRRAVISDEEGKDYIDYVLSWGPLILGHADPVVIQSVVEAAQDGLSFGAPTVRETLLALEIKKYFPGMEKIRFVNSGTEAVMSAIRLARGYTGRKKIVKFIGCYHGHSDHLLVEAGSGGATLNQPNSKGVTEAAVADTLLAEYNRIDPVRELFREHPDDIAAVIVEPLAGNMGVVPPVHGFLEGLRRLCDQEEALLIFDEVMSGFRAAMSGAQGHYGVTPDMTILGKVIGGGMPVGAFGACREIMDELAPLGGVYQAGTLSGNPVAMAAGLATLRRLGESGVFETAEVRCRELAEGWRQNLDDLGLDYTIHQVGTMVSMFFRPGPVETFADAANADREGFTRFFHAMLNAGIYMAPSPFESAFTSTAHTPEQIARTIESHYQCLA